MNEQHREIIELAVFDLESKSGVRWGPEYMEEFAAAIRAALAEVDALKADANLVSLNAVNAALAAEVAALKAHDPLAEMWRELEAYQEQADRDGHGESWARMCSERTEKASRAASRAASWAAMAAVAVKAAASAASAASWAAAAAAGDVTAAQSIAAIRRAKEGQR
jgi:hypothetical protein